MKKLKTINICNKECLNFLFGATACVTPQKEERRTTCAGAVCFGRRNNCFKRNDTDTTREKHSLPLIRMAYLNLASFQLLPVEFVSSHHSNNKTLFVKSPSYNQWCIPVTEINFDFAQNFRKN